MNKPQVFITQDSSGKDFSQANQYGALRILTPTNVGADYGKLYDLIAEVIAEQFKPETDFLIPIGNPIVVGLAFTAIFDLHPFVNVLMWDKQTQRYNVKKVELYDN